MFLAMSCRPLHHCTLLVCCICQQLQALRSKYFLVGQNLNTNAQSTAVSRPPQPVAPHPPNKQSNAVAQQLNSQNHENNATKLGKASYKKFSTSSQFGQVLNNDVSSGSVSIRQPTPGIGKSMALIDTNLDNFKTSKSNIAANLGSKSDHQKSAASSEKEDSIKGSLADSKSVKEGNSTESNRGHHHLPNITSKFPPLSQQPLWKAANKPALENKRTSYNPVILGGGARHLENNHKQQQQVWGRIRRDTVADVEGVPGSDSRRPQDG